MLENYHTHTTRCRHATGSEEEYIQHALVSGLKVLGFSDHTPFIFPGSYYSRMRMFPDQIGDYAQTVMKLKEKYDGQIQIRLGLEVEYYPDLMEDMLKLIEPWEIEYMILGQHWCGTEIPENYNGRPTDDPALLVRYYDTVIEAMGTGMFSYVAHPDLFLFTGDPDFYRSQILRLCEAAKALDTPLELNLLGLRENRHYPQDCFWEIAGEVSVKTVLGCDAHAPENLTDTLTKDKAMQMVEKYHLQLLDHVPIHPYTRSKIVK